MRAIWKFDLTPLHGVQQVRMPSGARPLHVAEQYGRLRLWAIVDTEAQEVEHELVVVGTGKDLHPLERDAQRVYIGTAHVAGEVWHVFQGVRL